MATNPIQSAWLRFFRKFGVAFFWAFIIGLAFGSAAYFRVDRRDLEGDLRWHVVLRLWLEKLEWATFDWRSRELGAASERSDDVVIAAIDDETVVNARESEHPDWAMNPWPRELLGSVTEQLIREGASLVIIEGSLADVSPHFCQPCRADAKRTDDELLAAKLEKLGNKVVLGFDWQREGRRPPDRALAPFLVKLGESDALPGALATLRQALARRVPTFLFEKEGKQQVWGGASSEAKARELAAVFEQKTPTVRTLTPADDDHEISREWLVQHFSAVESALPAEVLPRVGAFDGPVAPLLMAQAPAGAMTITPDADGVVRAVPLLIATNDAPPQVLPSAAVLAVMQLGNSRVVAKTGAAQLTIAQRFIVPVDSHGFLSIQWSDDEAGRGARGTMKRSVPAWRLLVNHDDDDAGRGVRHYDNDLAGRVVILTDARRDTTWATPVGQLSRASILAQAVSDLLKGQGVSRALPEVDFWFTMAFALVGGVVAVAWSSLVRRPGWLAWVATIGIAVALHALIARQIFVTQQRQVVVVAPLLAFALTFLASLGYARALEQSLRDFMFRALGGAVRADVFRQVERDLKLMRPERRPLTVYFSDIEGFTSVADAQDPAAVVKVLQQYLGEMTTLVLDRNGYVDKYLGDGLMAFWGAPLAVEDAPAIACQAALAMQSRFESKKAEWEKVCGRPLVLRAGIEAGPTLVGEMGTSHRVNYTVMGEPVARAFRLEALAKTYDARILVGAEVAAGAGGAFVFREVDTVRVRGDTPTVIHELLGLRSDFAEADLEAVKAFGEALSLWKSRQFAQAKAAFEALAIKHPDDGLIHRYVARCTWALANPMPDSWDGVYAGA